MYLESHNFHWREGFSYDYPQRRDVFHKLVNSLNHRRICVLTGTRRTGKTTLMKQFIDHLIDNGTPRANIVYYSFDEDRPSIRDIVQEYERRIGKEIAFSKDKYFIFLDEIQKLDDWQNKIKYFYDHYKNLKFIVSGSASLFIKEKARESLAGRMEELSVGSLSFMEYLIFKKKEDMLAKPDMFS
ncbi:MAG: AAA family ATPase, partial [Thermoplasmata archaeon]|nr:AAA family ATPase [Thermoplasmata archaeon]